MRSDDLPDRRNLTELGLLASGILAAVGDPDAADDAPHLVMVADPEVAPNFRQFYGPSETALQAAEAVDLIRSTIDFTGGRRSYTVHALHPTPRG